MPIRLLRSADPGKIPAKTGKKPPRPGDLKRGVCLFATFFLFMFLLGTIQRAQVVEVGDQTAFDHATGAYGGLAALDDDGWTGVIVSGPGGIDVFRQRLQPAAIARLNRLAIGTPVVLDVLVPGYRLPGGPPPDHVSTDDPFWGLRGADGAVVVDRADLFRDDLAPWLTGAVFVGWFVVSILVIATPFCDRSWSGFFACARGRRVVALGGRVLMGGCGLACIAAAHAGYIEQIRPLTLPITTMAGAYDGLVRLRPGDGGDAVAIRVRAAGGGCAELAQTLDADASEAVRTLPVGTQVRAVADAGGHLWALDRLLAGGAARAVVAYAVLADEREHARQVWIGIAIALWSLGLGLIAGAMHRGPAEPASASAPALPVSSDDSAPGAPDDFAGEARRMLWLRAWKTPFSGLPPGPPRLLLALIKLCRDEPAIGPDFPCVDGLGFFRIAAPSPAEEDALRPVLAWLAGAGFSGAVYHRIANPLDSAISCLATLASADGAVVARATVKVPRRNPAQVFVQFYSLTAAGRILMTWGRGMEVSVPPEWDVVSLTDLDNPGLLAAHRERLSAHGPLLAVGMDLDLTAALLRIQHTLIAHNRAQDLLRPLRPREQRRYIALRRAGRRQPKEAPRVILLLLVVLIAGMAAMALAFQRDYDRRHRHHLPPVESPAPGYQVE
jgi:hypothetical protein